MVRSTVRRAASGLARFAGRVRPGAAARPPWERTVLDDLAVRRPWNVLVKLARRRALLRLRVRGLEPGVTVVVVSWNTREVLADVLHAVRALSPPDHRVLVVDNGSTDGTREMLRQRSGISTILLRQNVGHGAALDLAVCAARTKVVVTLDSDAIPLREGWWAPAVEPVRAGAVLAGVRSRRGFVHPMYLAVDTAAFVRRNLSFQLFRESGVAREDVTWGEDAWDTGELLTGRLEPDEVAFVERTENAAPGLPGMTAGGVVYHHGGVSRGADGAVSADALSSWRDACRALAVPGAGPC